MKRSILLASLVSALCGCQRQSEVVVFHAASLRRVLSDAAEEYQREHAGTRIRLEPSGSQVAARKVSELGMRADVVATADIGVLDKILLPQHARWSLAFATNEIVLAHKDHSRFTDEITESNWPEVLQREGLRLGRASEDTAPLGYNTLTVWQLAERDERLGDARLDLTQRLVGRCPQQHVAPDEGELLALLESRAIDYAFVYRSTAEDHHLKITALFPELNLSRPELADRYGQVGCEVRMKQSEERTQIRGAPIVYGLTVPTKAANPQGAQSFVAFLLGERGRKLLERAGFHPLAPARSTRRAEVPESLRALVAP